MLFSSTIFLFCFLPTVALLYWMAKKPLQQYVLLFGSLLFYAWGEPKNLAVMLLICLGSYISALAVQEIKNDICRRAAVFFAVILDLGILGYYKYANFFIENINEGFHAGLPLMHVIMPIGISFFTFQAMSYVIDVYRGVVQAQRSFQKLVLYISFFPQLIAGPIVKYHDIEKDLENNTSSLDDVLYGIKRFIIGLGKKVLIANQLGTIADPIFNNGYQSADMSLAWLGAVAYSLQLFFDFSGYSDMAIGLGRIFGFHFLENFNYPYISKSITEFWRRWHISLGTWFKEYVYIPLGGNRHGKYRTYLNLWIVFLVTGIWHGANWTFILWGMWHGLFILIERLAGIKSADTGRFAWLRHIYTTLAFIIGWTMFRADTVSEGLGFIGTMFGLVEPETALFKVGYFLTMKSSLVMVLALLFSLPIGRWVSEMKFIADTALGRSLRNAGIICILLLSIAHLAASTYNPFIYFRF